MRLAVLGAESADFFLRFFQVAGDGLATDAVALGKLLRGLFALAVEMPKLLCF